jgi:hypothetical protein
MKWDGEYPFHHRKKIGLEERFHDIYLSAFAIRETDALEVIFDLKRDIYLRIVTTDQYIYLLYGTFCLSRL